MLLGKKGRKARVEGGHGSKQDFQKAVQCGSLTTPHWREGKPSEKTQSQVASPWSRNDPAAPFLNNVIWAELSTRNQIGSFHFAWKSYATPGLQYQQDIAMHAKLLYVTRVTSGHKHRARSAVSVEIYI